MTLRSEILSLSFTGGEAVKAGDPFVWRDTLYLGVLAEDGSVDEGSLSRWLLDGWSGACQVRAERRSSSDLLADAAVVLSDEEGEPSVTVTLTAEQTAALERRTGWLDVQLTSPDGDPTTIAEGSIEFGWQVTA